VTGSDGVDEADEADEADGASPAAPDPDRMPRWVPRAILFFFGVMLALGLIWWLVIRLRSLLVMILVALFLSFALEPAVNWLADRGWRRGPATGLVMLALFVMIALFVWAMGSLLVDQVTELVDEAPRYIENTERWVNDSFNAEVDADDLVDQFQEGGTARDFAANLAGNIVSAGATVVTVLFQLLTILLFTFYLVADGPRLRRAVLSVLHPDRQREVLRVWEIAIDKTGGYIYSRGLLAFFSAIFHGIAFALIGIPFPIPLAIWVGLISQFVPTVGTYIAGALPIAIALVENPVDAIWVLAVVVIYQQMENYLLAPPIQAETMDMHPAVAFGAVIAGASILGPIGALLALPAGATGQAFVTTYLRRHEVVESRLTRSPQSRINLLRPLTAWRRGRGNGGDSQGTTSDAG
jgi:predicted PurR-regulated permease PerM